MKRRLIFAAGAAISGASLLYTLQSIALMNQLPLLNRACAYRYLPRPPRRSQIPSLHGQKQSALSANPGL